MKNSKEYSFYRFMIMVFILMVVNFAVLISEGNSYYYWYIVSFVLMIVLLIIDAKKTLQLIQYPRTIKFSRNTIYLLAFVISYPAHYQLSRHIDYQIISFFQIVNVVLFILTFCIEEKFTTSTD